ncbi:MAG: type II CAAX endopeptidase family protein [Limosilactobacillus sp.]|uniref:CPBP family intramembrane glutamic endopeptidase n=1 Tax=Limosilactobacillus sp. TaxID=2773925 RepID=UPI0027049CA0|nr:type II CAAX endopeptidase family protein [Limosilactobacillus sp.]
MTQKNKIWNWCCRVGLVAVFFLLIQIPPVAVQIANYHPHNQMLAVIMSVLFVVIFCFIIWAANKQYQRYNQLGKGGPIKISMVIWGYVSLMVIPIFFNILNQYLFHQNETENNHIIRELLNHNMLITIVFAIGSFTLTPIAEELIFRGMLTNMFFKPDALWQKMLLSGLVFSAAHTSTNVVSFLLYVFMGAMLAYIYRKSGSLKNSILVHALNNFVAMAVMLASII